MSISVSSGLVDITIQDEVYWGWGGVMMLINGGGSVNKTYTFKVKKGGATPIRTKSGTTMNQDVYVSITLKNGDGTPPTITSSTFDSLNLNMVPPHQPIEYFFSENMSNGRIPWLATKQGGQSVASALNNPFSQVSGYYDHLGGYRFLIYNLGGGLDIDTEYEYTILGADMDPALNLFLTPAMDPTGEKMRNTYTRRFRTSKVKITDPKSSNVRVLMGGQEVDIIPTITSLPVRVTGQTTPDVDVVMLNSTTGETGKSATMTPGTPNNTFSSDFYFKQPGKKEIRVTGYKQYTEPVTGAKFYLPYGGKDYIKLNVPSPPPQNWLAKEFNEDFMEASFATAMLLFPWGIPAGETILGVTVPYLCYDILRQYFAFNYHLYVSKSIYKFISLPEDYRLNFDVSLHDDPSHNGYFISNKEGTYELSVDISTIPVEVNITYTNIPPVIKAEPPPPPPGINCLEEQNALSCVDECIKCPAPPDPEYTQIPDYALWKGAGRKIHIYQRIKEIDLQCGYITVASLGRILCHKDLSTVGSRIEGLNIEYDLIPVLLITETNEYLIPSQIPSPPYRPFFLIRNFMVHDIGNVEFPCIADWIIEELLEDMIPKDAFESSFNIDLQTTPEWGTYYFTGGIQVQEEFSPAHKVKVFFEYLPGLRDN